MAARADPAAEDRRTATRWPEDGCIPRRGRTPVGRRRRARRAAPRPGRRLQRRPTSARKSLPAGSSRRPARHRAWYRIRARGSSRGPSAAGPWERGDRPDHGVGGREPALEDLALPPGVHGRVRSRPGEVHDGVGPIEGRGEVSGFVPPGPRRSGRALGRHGPGGTPGIAAQDLDRPAVAEERLARLRPIMRDPRR